MFAFPLLLVRALRLGSLSCLLFLLFQWPPKPWHSDEHQGSRWMSIPLKCGIIGLISKSSASGSVCAQTVSPRFNVTCKCDLAPKTSHGKTKAAPPLSICTMLVACNIWNAHQSDWTHILQIVQWSKLRRLPSQTLWIRWEAKHSRVKVRCRHHFEFCDFHSDLGFLLAAVRWKAKLCDFHWELSFWG